MLLGGESPSGAQRNGLFWLCERFDTPARNKSQSFYKHRHNNSIFNFFFWYLYKLRTYL